MCGIAGVFCSTGIAPYRGAMEAAMRVGQHRGPDGQGIAAFDPARPGRHWLSLEAGRLPDDNHLAGMTLALGHLRLAILDLSAAGLQPMPNEDARVWIVFNGEIYNYLELRAELEQAGHGFRSHSDTEVILHAYEAWGDHCVQRFVGMWAFALVDLRRGRLFCSRDRFGIKPLHYCSDGRHFAFASEIKQLLQFGFVPRRVNERSVYEYLAHESVDWGPETFYEGVLKLSPGHNLSLDLTTGAVAVNRYYAPALAIDRTLTPVEAAREFGRRLADSVRLHMRSDVPVGSCLSGGLDSSAIVCLMDRHLRSEGKHEIQHTFSSHFDEPEANELEYMQQVIRATGVQAHFTNPQPASLLEDLNRLVLQQDEPFGSTSLYAQWSVFRLIHEHGVKVVLDGQGADEQLAGYVSLAPYYFLELKARRSYPRLLWETWRHARLQGRPWLSVLPGALGLPARALAHLGRRTAATAALEGEDWLQPEMAAQYAESPYLALFGRRAFDSSEILNNALYQFTFLVNLPALLRYEDRNSMAFSVESRVPYLDHRLVEFVFSLPASFKIRHGYTKRVMREALAGVIPEAIRWRARKLGFATPESTWQHTTLLPLVRRALDGAALRPYVRADRAQLYLDSVRRRGQLTFVPWRWLNLSMWLEAFRLG